MPNLFLAHSSVARNAFSVETDMACDSGQRIKRTIKVKLCGKERGHSAFLKGKVELMENFIGV